MTREILLGHEVDTGELVYIDPDHLLGTGLTQQSGKTTTLNALISRSGRRAVAFRTKRGEIEWMISKRLEPFYTQPKQRGGFIDWSYVESILEAHLGERVKFERRWIMRSCEGAQNLRGVYENIQRLEQESKHYFDKGQYYLLSNYFEKILPQVESRKWATSLPLVKGVNLMDLEDMSFEMQSLVIERVMNHVLTKMKDVIIVLPEARKFIPLSAKTPVTGTAIKMAAEGAVLELDLWVDSQTYSSINNEVRKQCGTQLHGVQMDNNEAKTVADLLDKKWKVEEIKGLRLGHFLVKTKDKRYKHVYVLPAGVPEEMGRKVATGELPVQVVSDYLASMKDKQALSDEEMYRQENESLREEIRDLRRQLEELQEGPDVETTRDQDVKDLREQLATVQAEKEGLEQDIEELRGRPSELDKIGELEEKIQGLEEELSNLREGAQAVSELRGVLIRILGVDMVDVSREGLTAPSSMATNEVIAIVDGRLSQVLHKMPEARIVAVDVDEAARDVLRKAFVSDIADKIRGLSNEPKRAALIIRERTPIRTSELYLIMRGKKGRIPGNFYQQIHRLEAGHLATYTRDTGLVTWNLDAFLEERLRGLCDEEALSQVKDFLVSLLLPEAQS